MQLLFSSRWKLWHGSGAEDGFDDPPQRHPQALRDFISNQREVVYFFPGLLIFKDISESVCIWLSWEGYLGMKAVDIQLALEFPGKQQRGGLKRHFLAHQDCHNTSSFQSTLSLSQQIFKPFEGKREMRRPREASGLQPRTAQPWLSALTSLTTRYFRKANFRWFGWNIYLSFKKNNPFVKLSAVARTEAKTSVESIIQTETRCLHSSGPSVSWMQEF